MGSDLLAVSRKGQRRANVESKLSSLGAEAFSMSKI